MRAWWWLEIMAWKSDETWELYSCTTICFVVHLLYRWSERSAYPRRPEQSHQEMQSTLQTNRTAKKERRAYLATRHDFALLDLSKKNLLSKNEGEARRDTVKEVVQPPVDVKCEKLGPSKQGKLKNWIGHSVHVSLTFSCILSWVVKVWNLLGWFSRAHWKDAYRNHTWYYDGYQLPRVWREKVTCIPATYIEKFQAPDNWAHRFQTLWKKGESFERRHYPNKV